MRSALPKVLHPLCGRPLVVWPIARRPRGRRRPHRRRRLGRSGRSTATCRRTSSSPSRSEPHGTGDARRGRRARHFDRDAAGGRPLRRRPARHRRGDRASCVAAHAAAGAAATMATMVLDDPGGYGRIVRAADGDVERVVETKARRRRDRRASSRSARSTPASTPSTAAPLLDGARPASRPTTRRASTTCPTCCRCCAPPGQRVAAHVVDDPALTLGVNDRADLAAVRGDRPARASSDAPHARRRDDRRPGLDRRSTPTSRSAATR